MLVCGERLKHIGRGIADLGAGLGNSAIRIPPSLIIGRVPKRRQDSSYLVPAFPRSPPNIVLTVNASCSRQYGLARIGGRSAILAWPLSNVSVAYPEVSKILMPGRRRRASSVSCSPFISG